MTKRPSLRMPGSRPSGDISDIRRLAAAMKASQGGRNLIETGQQQDIEIAAYVDKLDTVPQLDVVQWSIR